MFPAMGAKTIAVVCLALLLSGTAFSQAAQDTSASQANTATPQAQPTPPSEDNQGSMQQQPVTAPTRRVPGARVNLGAAVLGLVQSREGIPLGGVQVALQPMGAGKIFSAETSA